MSLTRPQRVLMVALSASAGIHAGLVPAHAADATVGALFGVSAVALLGLAVAVDRAGGRVPAMVAALLLGSLLAAYAASRVIAVAPLTHAEPVDALGLVTKLIEAAGLVLALSLVRTPAGGDRRLPAQQEGAGP
jgi:hypothetical protein